MIEMEQLRQETDDAGPQDELEYWKRRMAKFKFLSEQMDSPQVREQEIEFIPSNTDFSLNLFVVVVVVVVVVVFHFRFCFKYSK